MQFTGYFIDIWNYTLYYAKGLVSTCWSFHLLSTGAERTSKVIPEEDDL